MSHFEVVSSVVCESLQLKKTKRRIQKSVKMKPYFYYNTVMGEVLLLVFR